MDHDAIWATVLHYWIPTVIILILFSLLTSALRRGLRNVPGPFLAKFSYLELMFHVLKCDTHTYFNRLHERYGAVVRVAPDKVSVADPDALSVIYGIGTNFLKASFYTSFTNTHDGAILENLFATTDPVWHKQMKSVLAPAYSLSYLRYLEPLVDECSEVFMKAMEDLACQPIDLGEWLQWYAFDTIGNITFSQTFNFMEQRSDPRNVVDSLEAGNYYNIIVGQIPSLHPWIFGNWRLTQWAMSVPALANANPITTINQMIATAKATPPQTDVKTERGNFLDFLNNVQAQKPGVLSDRDHYSALMVNLFAGSDTTGITLKAVMYYLIKNPTVYQRLEREIEETEKEGTFSHFVTFEQGSKMTYLQAVIKETLRIHPGVSYPLERVVPPEGTSIAGYYLPGGTVVGMHAWVLHRDKDIFHPDPDAFRPERWLIQDKEQLKRMNRVFIPFGSGNRTCIGKHISMLEMTKFIPQLLRRFNLAWASEVDEWKISSGWFARQTGLKVRLTPKELPRS